MGLHYHIIIVKWYCSGFAYEKACSRQMGVTLDFWEQPVSDITSLVLMENQKAISALSNYYPFR